MPFGLGDGGIESFMKKAALNAKVLAKDAVKGGSNLVSKVTETDVKSTAKRFTNKVMERAEGANFALVEELPEVESAMVNLKQTETAYKELLAVLKDSFVSQTRSCGKQLRVANRAEVIGRDLEGETIGGALCAYSTHLVNTAERSLDLNNIRDAADVEERAQDDFEQRVYETPAAKLIASLETFILGDLTEALAARTKYKDVRREVSLNTIKAQELEAKHQQLSADALKKQVTEGTVEMEAAREELMG